jgi:hypothetical protein
MKSVFSMAETDRKTSSRVHSRYVSNMRGQLALTGRGTVGNAPQLGVADEKEGGMRRGRRRVIVPRECSWGDLSLIRVLDTQVRASRSETSV